MQPDSPSPVERPQSSPAEDVRAALQRLRDEGSKRGVELHAKSNENWRSRKNTVREALQRVKNRGSRIRQGYYNMLGTVRVLMDQPTVRREVGTSVENSMRSMFERIEDSTNLALDRATERGIEARARARDTVKNLYRGALDRLKNKGSRAQSTGERLLTRAHVKAQREILRGLVRDPRVGDAELKATQSNRIREAISKLRALHAGENPNPDVFWSSRADSARGAVIDLKPLPVVDVTPNSVTDVDTYRVEPRAVPFATSTASLGSAGATPEPGPTGITPSQDVVDRATELEAVAKSAIPSPLPVSPNPKYNAV